MEIKKVGVVGCGIMGAGITQVCAQSGYKVVVSEANDKILSKGLAAVNASMGKGVEKGKLTQQQKDSAWASIKGTASLQDFNDCDLVVEAATENMDLKKQIFATLDKVCPKHAILGTNTSCLSVIDMAGQTARADKVLGLHFFNPALIMRPVEVIRTIATSGETVETVKGFVKSLGKVILLSKDSPGFLVTRLGMIQRLEAIRMVEAGLGSAEDIDNGLKLGYNYPMGPLELGDMVGLDTTLSVATAIYEVTRDPKFAPPVLLQKMVAAGWLGRKSGKGFYDYNK